MNFTPLEIIATLAALVAASAAIWQGALTRRAIRLSYDTVLLDHRLTLCSAAYSSMQRFKRILHKNNVDSISDESLTQATVELDTAWASITELNFKSRAGHFSDLHSKFGEFYIWFWTNVGKDGFTHSFFEEAGLRIEPLTSDFYVYAKRLQFPEEKS